MNEKVRACLSHHAALGALFLGLALLTTLAVPAGAQVPGPGGCAFANLPDAAPTPTIATLTIPLLEQSASSKPGVDDEVNAQYCYWRWLADCGDCVYQFSCWLWYGSENQYGKECIGRKVEYCDGHPTGIEVPVFEIQCGCNP